MILAVSYCQMPGKSCPREMRPVPIAPTLMRLPGENAPSTDEGMMAGKPATAATLPASPRNWRRVRVRAMSALQVEVDRLRLLLPLQHQLHREERVRLRHRRLRAIDHVGDQTRAERQLDVVAVDVAHLLLIDDEQVIAAGTPGDVDVLAQLDVAVGAQDR